MGICCCLLDPQTNSYQTPRPPAGALSTLEISSAQSTGTSQPSTTEPPILKAAQELLIAEAVSKQQNINLNRLMKARSHTPGLYEAVAVIMEAKRSGNQGAQTGKEQALNMEVIPFDVKDSALESIMAACNNLGFTCRQAGK